MQGYNFTNMGPSWPWSYGSYIYNWLSPLMLWVQISVRARRTALCDKVCQWLATGRWFSLGPPVSSTNKTDRHDLTEILLKVTLNTIKQTNKQNLYTCLNRVFQTRVIKMDTKYLHRFWLSQMITLDARRFIILTYKQTIVFRLRIKVGDKNKNSK